MAPAHDSGGDVVVPDSGPTVVSCARDADCAAAVQTPVCAPRLQRCVQCLADSDCPAEFRCGDDRSCVRAAPCQNTLDCPSGLVCERSINRCVECVGDGECGAGERCAKNSCRRACDSDLDCSALGRLCDRGSSSCVDCLEKRDCPTNRFCENGACSRCEPGTFRCVVGGISECNGDGSGYGAPVECAPRQSCSPSGMTAACQDHTCIPGRTFCGAQGEKVMACAADGLSSSVVEDCAASGGVCAGAACHPRICDPTKIYCEGSKVMHCSFKGDATTKLLDCDPTRSYCNAASAQCSSHVCKPSAPACNNSVATTCNANGSGFVGAMTDCRTTSQVCFNGVCRTPCSANRYNCVNGDVYICHGDGFTNELVDNCDESEFCIPDSPSCSPDACAPGQPVCENNRLTACKPDGSGGEPGGTDCAASSKVCDAGQCHTPVCAPFSYLCVNGDVHYCDGKGLTTTVVADCPADYYCKNGDSYCYPQVCTPNAVQCVGTVIRTCNGEGSAFQDGGTDCAPQYCVGTACSATLFSESFEDGDYAGWTLAGHTANVTSSTAANGTSRSIALQRTEPIQTPDQQLSIALPGVQPRSISWWARSDRADGPANLFRVRPASTTHALMFAVTFDATATEGRIYLIHSGPFAVSQPYVANTWYHFEIKNIDWTNYTFDYYVDGVERARGLYFYYREPIGQIDLLMNDTLATGYFDEIELR